MDMLAHENAVLDINNLLEISKDAGLENTGIRCVCRMSKITIGAAIWLKHLKNGLIRTFRRCEISQLCGFPNIIFSVIQVGWLISILSTSFRLQTASYFISRLLSQTSVCWISKVSHIHCEMLFGMNPIVRRAWSLAFS